MSSYALNAPPSVPLKYILLFGTGALIMRGAGCTINDLWDRNLDNAVGMHAYPSPFISFFFECDLTFFICLFYSCSCLWPSPERTKTRPLARGDITPRQAIAFLAPQLTAGLAVLTQLNWYRCVPKVNERKTQKSQPTPSPSPSPSQRPASSSAPPRCPW